MNTKGEISYRIKTASESEIYMHLKKCNDQFIPPLNVKVVLNEYAGKIFHHSVTFEAWHDELLAGLIAAYFNDQEKRTGFITNVSVLPGFGGKGIASDLLKMSFDHARQKNFSAINLEVNHKNKKAIGLYSKFGFVILQEKDDIVLMQKTITI